MSLMSSGTSPSRSSRLERLVGRLGFEAVQALRPGCTRAMRAAHLRVVIDDQAARAGAGARLGSAGRDSQMQRLSAPAIGDPRLDACRTPLPAPLRSRHPYRPRSDDPDPRRTTSTTRFATRAVHAGQVPDPLAGRGDDPDLPDLTYVQEGLGRHKGYEYARTQNPTREALERNVASLEGGDSRLRVRLRPRRARRDPQAASRPATTWSAARTSTAAPTG